MSEDAVRLKFDDVEMQNLHKHHQAMKFTKMCGQNKSRNHDCFLSQL